MFWGINFLLAQLAQPLVERSKKIAKLKKISEANFFQLSLKKYLKPIFFS
jgi:hypothetical protein